MDERDAAILADPILAGWLARDPAVDAPGWALALPTAEALPPLHLDLAVPHEDIPEVVAHLPAPGRSGLLWPLLGRCAAALVGSIGQVASSPRLPTLPEACGPGRRYFSCYVLLAALPRLRAFHRARGIPEAEPGRHRAADGPAPAGIWDRRAGVTLVAARPPARRDLPVGAVAVPARDRE